MEIAKCCYCKQKPEIVRLPGDLFYVQCSCGRQGLYDFLGATRKLAVEAWNAAQYTRTLYNKGENV